MLMGLVWTLALIGGVVLLAAIGSALTEAYQALVHRGWLRFGRHEVEYLYCEMFWSRAESFDTLRGARKFLAAAIVDDTTAPAWRIVRTKDRRIVLQVERTKGERSVARETMTELEQRDAAIARDLKGEAA